MVTAKAPTGATASPTAAPPSASKSNPFSFRLPGASDLAPSSGGSSFRLPTAPTSLGSPTSQGGSDFRLNLAATVPSGTSGAGSDTSGLTNYANQQARSYAGKVMGMTGESIKSTPPSWLGSLAGTIAHPVTTVLGRALSVLGSPTSSFDALLKTDLQTEDKPGSGPTIFGSTPAAYAAAGRNFLNAIEGNPTATGEDVMNTAAPNAPPWVKAAAGFGMDLANPLSWVAPGGVIKDVAQAPKVVDAINALREAAGGTRVGASALGAMQKLASGFNRFAGMRPAIRNGILDMEGKTVADSAQAQRELDQVFKGTTPEQRTLVTYAREGDPQSIMAIARNPQLMAALGHLENLYGSTGRDLLDRGLIGNRIEDGYVPHILASHFEGENPKGVYANLNKPMKAYISASKSRTLQGSIKEINDRLATDPKFATSVADLTAPSGKLFETDAYKLALSHALQAHRAINLHDFIHGVVLPQAYKADRLPATLPENLGAYRPKTLNFFPNAQTSRDALDELATGGKDSVPLESLRPGFGVRKNSTAYIMPKAEARFLNGYTRSFAGDSPLSLMEPLSNSVRSLMLFNPLIHFPHNVTTMAFLHDPGAVLNPAQWMSHLREAAAHSGPWYDLAMRSGAISEATNPSLLSHGTNGISARVNAALSALDKSGTAKLASVLNPYRLSQIGTWVPEHAMRTALFRRAVQRGQTYREAADFVNRALGAYRNLTPFEQSLQRGVFPFYSWLRTSIPGVIRQTATNPGRTLAITRLENAINYYNTGKNMDQTAKGQEGDISLGNGTYVNPYLPTTEAFGTLPHEGVLEFLFNRTYPWERFAAQVASNEQNPLSGENYKFPVVPMPAAEGTNFAYLNNQPLFFGNVGPKVNPYLALASQDLSNPVGFVGQEANQPALQSVLDLLGMYASKPKPGGAAENAAYTRMDRNKWIYDQLKKAGQGQ